MPKPVDAVPALFESRAAAAEALADRLVALSVPGAIVLAIPRGGVPVGAVVAHRLGLTFDILVSHRVSAPWHPELELGAIAADGTRVIDVGGAVWLGSADAIRDAGTAEMERAREREHWLRAGRPPLLLAGRTVILVDDGMALGATMEAAVLSARRSGAARVIVAVPVASPASVSRLEAVADVVVAVATPEPLAAVRQWHDALPDVSDRETAALLAGEPAGPSSPA
jgi:predicted phosphoribosyltransferase